MKICSTSKYIADGKAIISAEIESTDFAKPQTIFFAYPQRFYDYLPASADPFFPAVLIPAMISGQNLEIVPPVSSKIIKNQPQVQAVFGSWFPEKFHNVKVIAPDRVSEKPADIRQNATFFSLGVDSMYSMLKYLPVNQPAAEKHLSALIYMKGLELPLSTYTKGQGGKVIEVISKLAQHYNLDLVYGETNIRDVFPLVWEKYYSGPGLAATALSLTNGFRNVFIPSSHSYANLSPNPSSPLVDNLWSNEKTQIIHDGAEIERAQKIVNMIVKDQYAFDNLRVCIDNEGDTYNCGKCWKCVRTMVTLKIIDKLKDSRSFPHDLPRHYCKNLRTFDKSSMKFTIENLKLAREYGNRDIEKVLQREIRIGKLDLFREGKRPGYLFTELMHYFFIKTGRRLRILPWHHHA